MKITAQNNANMAQEAAKAQNSQASSKVTGAAAMMPPPGYMEQLKDALQEAHTLPGKAISKLEDFFFDSPSEIVENALFTATHAKTPNAEKMALNHFYNDIKGMTPGELDDVKDTIVKRMASNKTSQRERDTLHKMYNLADALAENRKPEKPKMPKPWFDKLPVPKMPKFPMPSFPAPIPMPIPYLPDVDPKWLLAKMGA